jgi:hypothetical protein
LNPSAEKIQKLFIDEGETIVNDHIAFRTFSHPLVNIEVLSKPFAEAGYVKAGYYHFEAKKLNAIHFEVPEDINAPRVFISELLPDSFSGFLKTEVRKLMNVVKDKSLFPEALLFAGDIFGKPSWDIYNRLREESEYASWLYVFGYRANHFTVSVNHLQKYNTLEKVNELLKKNGFKLNSSGGEIKGTPEDLLRQSSTLADIVPVEFKEGIYEIPACYYEFAQRYPDKKGEMYGGFVAKSADKIFESTDFYKEQASKKGSR